MCLSTHLSVTLGRNGTGVPNLCFGGGPSYSGIGGASGKEAMSLSVDF